MMAAFAEADCLIVRAPRAPAAAAGDPVEYLPLAHGTICL
jgi:molybdopterin molybdotransferase